ncbi:putative nucleophile aminohydrolase [Vibrio phage 501E54-1]|nr:putative nucleophile aminohydrolase [Vibrio phage 501E54-1]
MTTIAYRDKTMCSDSQATRGDFIDNLNTKKVFEVGEGILIGISGSALDALEFVEWFKDTLEANLVQEQNPYVSILPPEKLVNENFHCLVAYPDDTVYEFFGCEKVRECAEPYAAVGSGMFYAMCAMDAGASAEEAINVAIKRDVFSGGEVQVFKCEEAPEPISEEDIKAMSKEELLKLILPATEEKEEVVPSTEETSSGLESEPVKSKRFEFEEYKLEVRSDGQLDDCEDGELFTSFKTIVDEGEIGMIDLKGWAKALGIRFAHNISKDTLVERVDNKIAEIRETLVD